MPENEAKDPYNLQRFIDAQEPVYEQVLTELRAGSKQSHWMWFIFPQIAGLGHSPTAQHFAISGRDEATAYSLHPVLGPRLVECTKLMVQFEGKSAEEILGSVDAMKFRSSMTLFGVVAEEKHIFLEALAKYYDGKLDEATASKL